MIASVHVLALPFAVVLFLGFLVLLAVLAKIAGSATRGSKDGPRGCLGGCGLVLVLMLLGVLGIAGFVAFVATMTGVAAVEHNPIRSIDVIVPNAPNAPDAERGEYRGLREHEVPVLLRIEADRDVRDVLPRLRAMIERRFDLGPGDLERVKTYVGPDGSRIEAWFPMRRRDLDELRRELDAWGVDLGDGIRITLDSERGI